VDVGWTKRRAEDEPVLPNAAGEHVPARPPVEDVVAGSPVQPIHKTVADNPVVPAPAGDILEIADCVLGEAGHLDRRRVAAGKPERHGYRLVRVVDRVDAVAAVKSVMAGPAAHEVIAAAAVDRIVAV